MTLKFISFHMKTPPTHYYLKSSGWVIYIEMHPKLGAEGFFDGSKQLNWTYE